MWWFRMFLLNVFLRGTFPCYQTKYSKNHARIAINTFYIHNFPFTEMKAKNLISLIMLITQNRINNPISQHTDSPIYVPTTVETLAQTNTKPSFESARPRLNFHKSKTIEPWANFTMQLYCSDIGNIYWWWEKHTFVCLWGDNYCG